MISFPGHVGCLGQVYKIRYQFRMREAAEGGLPRILSRFLKALHRVICTRATRKYLEGLVLLEFTIHFLIDAVSTPGRDRDVDEKILNIGYPQGTEDKYVWHYQPHSENLHPCPEPYGHGHRITECQVGSQLETPDSTDSK